MLVSDAGVRGVVLLNQAKERREEFERTPVRFAAERLLYRLSASAARDRCQSSSAAT